MVVRVDGVKSQTLIFMGRVECVMQYVRDAEWKCRYLLTYLTC